ncbi:hypothetical protein Taro_007086, partial [Colocasia esculenta]|nr:hypothetical protein [Colocasia esculenta]
GALLARLAFRGSLHRIVSEEHLDLRHDQIKLVEAFDIGSQQLFTYLSRQAPPTDGYGILLRQGGAQLCKRHLSFGRLEAVDELLLKIGLVDNRIGPQPRVPLEGGTRQRCCEVTEEIYSGGPLASLSEAVIHDLFYHSPLGHDVLSCRGLGVYAPALLLGRVNGIVVGHNRVRVDIGQVALLMSSKSILVCRQHLAAWRIRLCLLPSLRQEVGHFSLPTLYEIILGVVCHRLEGGSGWRHEKYFSLFSISQQLLIPEMETRDFVFFPSFKVSLDLSRKGSLIMLKRRLKSLPQVRGSGLIALLSLKRSSGRIPDISEDSFVFLARFIYSEHSSGDARWPSRFPSRSVAGEDFHASTLFRRLLHPSLLGPLGTWTKCCPQPVKD